MGMSELGGFIQQFKPLRRGGNADTLCVALGGESRSPVRCVQSAGGGGEEAMNVGLSVSPGKNGHKQGLRGSRVFMRKEQKCTS